MSSAAATLSASVVITTKNRSDDLRQAVASALGQDARPEVIVMDDASGDGSGEMIRREFPRVRLHRSEVSIGLIAQRNRAAALASGRIIFSIDDDAIFTTNRVVGQTLAQFDSPRVGAVAIPFVNVRQDPVVHQRADDDRRIYAASAFIGTAHALRRDLFLKLGGYREFYFHQGEEEDYCLRLLAAGYVTRLGTADVIHHFESPRRDFRRMDLYGRRNNVLYAWYNVPMPYFPLHLLATTAWGVRLGFNRGRPWRMIRGLARGYAAIFGQWRQRRPVSRQTYRLSRLLKSRKCVPLEEIESMLPGMKV